MVMIDVQLKVNKAIFGIDMFFAIKIDFCKCLLLSSSWKDLNYSINTFELTTFVQHKLESHLLTRYHQGNAILKI